MNIVLLESLGISDSLLEQYAAQLGAAGHTFTSYPRTGDTARLIEEARDADVLMLANMPLPGEVIRACTHLKFIDVAFTGVDHVDLDAAREMGVAVSNASGYSNDSVAELTVCMALALLIPFSRLYLGVHTPLDVGVSFLIGWLLVLAFYPLLEEIGHRGEVLERIWLILLVPAALFLLYALRVRAGTSGDAANFDHAVKTAWSMLGLVLGAIISVFADRHYTRFETQAVWWAQILKVVLGLALTLAVRVALKAPLTAAFGANSVGDGIRYFAVVLMAGTLWPMTFGWFSLMGRKK